MITRLGQGIEAIGFVGIGNMGGPMVERIRAAELPIILHDRDSARAREVADATGASIAGSLADFEAVRLVVCMLPDSAVVEQILMGPRGLFEMLPRGALTVDMGSSDPRRTVELAKAAAVRGLELVDAPVSGGVEGARTGSLTIMFGGSEQQLERCRPLLEAVGKSIVKVGAVGAGHAMKALNNQLAAVGLAAAAEVIEVGSRFGLDPAVMLEVLNQSTGRNNATENKIEQYVLTRTFASGFSLRLMLKDVTTAVDLARAQKMSIPIGEACLEFWRTAADLLPVDADQTEIALLSEGTRQQRRRQPTSRKAPPQKLVGDDSDYQRH